MEININFYIASKTSFKIGPVVNFVLSPKNLKETIQALLFIKNNKIPYHVIGKGSNILFGGEYYKGSVLLTEKLTDFKIYPEKIKVLCGLSNTELSKLAYKHSIKNFEFMYYLPGSVGGSSFMNAQCFGSRFQDLILEILAIDENGNLKKYTADMLDFKYKSSIFQKNKELIFEITFKAEKGDASKILEKMNTYKQYRFDKGQFMYPSAGCIFKNDYAFNISSGQLIDNLKMANTNHGEAQIYEKHCNFIVNKNNASANDVKSLAERARKKVFENYGILLEYEIQFLGDFENG